MRDIQIDIASQDQPAKRMMRPAIQARFLDKISNTQGFESQNKCPNDPRTCFPKKQLSSQKMTDTLCSHQFTMSKLSLDKKDQESKQQFLVPQTQITYQRGFIFKGNYKNGKKVKGHFKFENGFEYQGNCKQNHFEGEGSLIFPSGKVITGKWKQSNLLSPAKIYYPTGEIYIGSIKNYKKHGYGHLYFNSRQKFVGQFRNGSISGNGAYFVDQQLNASGIWIDGQIVERQNIKSLQSFSSQGKYMFKSSTKQFKINKSIELSNQITSDDFSLADEDDIK